MGQCLQSVSWGLGLALRNIYYPILSSIVLAFHCAHHKAYKRDKTLSQEARDKINKSLPALAEYAAWGLVVYDPKNKVEMLDCEQTQKLNKFLSNYVEFSPPGSYRMLGDKASQAVKNTGVKFP